jgi:hypothetical protein
VTDLQETPAIEPEDEGGNERAGFRIAGAILVFVGWGLAVFLNALLHASAHPGGRVVGFVRISSTLGPFAWATLALGLFTGLFGVGMLWIARESNPGPVRLPGFPY